MSETDVSICARALVQLGENPITSLSEATDAAKTCANIYPGLKRAILSRYPWRFAMTKIALTKDATAPVGEWSNSFILPGDMLGSPVAVFMSTKDRIETTAFERFGQRLYTNHAELVIDYVADKLEAEWPAYFSDMMVAAMCSRLAFPVTDQQNVADRWYAEAFGTPSEHGMGGLMGDAATLDAQGTGQTGLGSDAFIDARQGGIY